MMESLKNSINLVEEAAREAAEALRNGDLTVDKARIFDADAWIEAAKAHMKAIMATGRA
jgi:hypothetical protein